MDKIRIEYRHDNRLSYLIFEMNKIIAWYWYDVKWQIMFVFY